jgi:alpha,alpha-trehalase
MYGWDSYFIILGLIHDGRIDFARGIVENFFFEIEHYGGILNANRTYYLSRSQPPFLSSMIREIWDADVAAGHKQEAQMWLALAYGYAQRDHALWTVPPHLAGTTGLARYYDFGDGPVPGMADDDAYYQNVIRWLLDHPQIHTDYVVDGPANPTVADREKIAAISCDPENSAICAHAHIGSHWLTKEFYKGDRAMRESGFDTSFRFGPFDGSTQNYAPVCLNALLYKYEVDLAWMAQQLSRDNEAQRWKGEAEARKLAMNKYLWNAAKGMYFDYDYTTGMPSDYSYLTTFYPLWAGAANPEQARAVNQNLRLFEKRGGLAMSTLESGVQWDLPYGWAPVTWLAIDGMTKNGDVSDAVRVAREFMATIRDNYASDHTIHEKYNVLTRSSSFTVSEGYRENVVGFGWTNAVYLKMQQLVQQN